MDASPSRRPATSRRSLEDDGWSPRTVSRRASSGGIERLLPATFADPAALAARPVHTRLVAARAHFGDDVVAVLGTAAKLHGLPTPWPVDGAVHVALPRGREQVQRPGYRFHTWLLDPDETCVVAGHRVTSLERTLVDLMCLTDRFSAVSALDAALHAGRLTRDDLVRLRATTVRRRGAARSRDWWALADSRAESPLETRVRLRAIDGGYRPDELQKVFDIPPDTARVDLVWRLPGERWLCVEADGERWHDTPEAVFRDRQRSNALVARGDVDPVHLVWADTVRASTVPRILRRHLGAPMTA